MMMTHLSMFFCCFLVALLLLVEPPLRGVWAKNNNGAWRGSSSSSSAAAASSTGRSFADIVQGSSSPSSSSSVDTTTTTTTTSNNSSPIKTPPIIQKKPGTSPPFYTKLPRGAQAYTLRNVYDGDTFTLADNEKRVRLLGIDTPEIKEQQPFAQEAKAFTKKYCCDGKQQSKVYLVFADRSRRPTTDHYGRCLAHVYVQEGDGLYLCVNEGLVAAGLACTYSPSSSSSNTGSAKPSNWATLVALQKQARQSQLGIWNNFDDIIVYKTKNGSAYHLISCEHLATALHLTPLRASQAADIGLHPCRSCLD